MDGFLKCICYLAILGIAAFLLGRILPHKWFHYDRFPWRMWKLEQGGAVYRKIRIYKWKEKFPDMSRIFPGIMPSKKVPRKFDPAQIREMIVETCIAEGIHGFLCLAGLGCLFLWKGPGGICAAVFYALGNIPYCLIQRFNRPKLVKILKSLKEKDRKEKREESNEESTHFKLQYRTGP